MKADSLRISKVFSVGGDVHYILPHFQREYAWEKQHWQTLLNDVVSTYEAYNSDSEPEHFMGALVVINDGTRNGTVPAFKLVDGQQRLVTISLFLCALGRILRDSPKDSHVGVYRKIQRLLTNPDEDGLLRYKLLPTTKYEDRASYLAIIQGHQIPANSESRIPIAFDFLHSQLENRIRNGFIDPEKLFLVLTNCLQVVFIDLDQRERPYEIFESLNHKGKALTQADLVRNYIAMKLPETRQEMIFSEYWSQIENLLQERRTVSRIGELTAFLRHYLAYHSGVLYNKDHIYARFRDRIEQEFNTPIAFEGEIESIKRFAEYYDHLLRPYEEPDEEICRALERLSTLELSTAYPFLLAAYEGMHNRRLSREQFIEGLEILENYIVRRHLADEQTNYLNKMFPTLWKSIDPSQFAKSLKEVLLTKNYPTDNRIRQILRTHQIYDRRSNERIYFVLDQINKYLSSGSGAHTVLDGDPTIEHVLPQSDNQEWKTELGSSWDETYRDYLHTLGNLTLVTQDWNSSLSSSVFSIKRDRLAHHGLALNYIYFGQHAPSRWDTNAIQNRTDWLVDQIIRIWPAFGEPPLVFTSTGQKPQLLEILDRSVPVDSWREVAIEMAETIATMIGSDEFDEIAQAMPTLLNRQRFSRTQQLSNGWWINLNLSGDRAWSFCSRLIHAAGLTDDDWNLELQSDATPNGLS